MPNANHTSSVPYFHPGDPAGHLEPDQPYIVDGLDWSWAFVLYEGIPEFPRYRVGTNGTVWSYCKSKKPGEQWKLLKQSPINPSPGHPYVPVGGAYLGVSLRKGVGPPKGYAKKVHILVLEAFQGPRPEGLECCHSDGNSRNNNFWNLRWATRMDNIRDMQRHGTMPRGCRRHGSKLDETSVAELKRLKRSGVKTKPLSERFRVSGTTIRAIMRGLKWSHIP